MSQENLILLMLSALLAVVSGQNCTCITANNRNSTTGLPTFQDYRSGSKLETNVIPHLHQAIITSYRFNCCGDIAVWGVDVSPDGAGIDRMFTLELQVWRPSPTIETTGCYSLVGNNTFTSVKLQQWVAIVTPLPQERIQFQPGDVLGFYVESDQGGEKEGVVILCDLNRENDRGYDTEEVWYAIRPSIPNNTDCPYPVGSWGVLNTFTRAAPVISPSIRSVECPPSTTTLISHLCSSETTINIQRTKSIVNLLSTPVNNDSQTVNILLESHPSTIGSQNINSIGLITGITATVVLVGMVVVSTLIVVGTIVCMKTRRQSHLKDKVPTNCNSNEAYGAIPKSMVVHIEDDTYDYPTMNLQVKESINTTQNEAYATNTEVMESMSSLYY